MSILLEEDRINKELSKLNTLVAREQNKKMSILMHKPIKVSEMRKSIDCQNTLDNSEIHP